MNIRKLFAIGTAVWLVFTAAIGVGLYHVKERLAETRQLSEISMSLLRSANDLFTLTGDYLLFGEERSERQWLDQIGSVEEILQNPSTEFASAPEVIEALRDEVHKMRGLFAHLQALRGNARARHNLPRSEAQLRDRLSAQLFARTQGTSAAALALRSESAAAREEALASATTLIAGLLASIVCAWTALWTLFARRVVVPMKELQDGIRAFGESRLTHRLTIRRKDEIGALAGALNEMAEQLTHATVSRDRLAAEIKAATAELEQANETLGHANADLEEFVYVASHDLKAPLRGIYQLAEWIAEDLADEMSDETRRNLQRLRLRIGRMERLIEDLLSYSRAGRVAIAIETVDTGELLEGIVEDVGPPDGFEVQLPSAAPSLVTAKTPLETVLRNLIANAIAHHDRDNGHVEIAIHPNGTTYEFAVFDDGPGIAPVHHERIFKLFQSLSRASDGTAGSGIGLSVAKRLAERFGGSLRVESPEGERGSVFRLSWPKHSA